MVPAGARRIDGIAGSAGTASRAQAAAGTAYRCGSIRGILRGLGLKVGAVTRKGFEARIRELVTGQATLERIAEAMLSARAALKAEYEKLHKAVLAIVREDAVCRRLMTWPSVGPLVAITYKSAMDDPSRIRARGSRRGFGSW